MMITFSKKKFLEKNWEGENRWRRVELNEISIEMGIDLCNKDSNKNLFDKILVRIDLYKKFIKQLPDYDTIIKNYKYDIDYDSYDSFVKYNKENFFIQTKSSYDFLEYFLENQTYKINEIEEWIPNENKYLFFHPNENKYCIM